MPERLKEIWSGFAGTTERRLTGRGVDNIAVPHRDHKGAEAPAEIGPIPAPATAAFEALKSRLGASKKSSRTWGEDDTAPPPQAFAPESAAARDLIRGLKSTEARTARTDRLYSEVAALPQKKRGLFRGASLKKRFILF